MTSPSLTNIPDRSPDQARAEIQRKDMAGWHSGPSPAFYMVFNRAGREVCRCDYESDRDAILRIARAHDALVKALEECAADYVSPPCTVQQGFEYARDEFLRRMAVARAALALAKGKENV